MFFVMDGEGYEGMKTFGDIIKAARTLEDLGLTPIEKCAADTCLRKNKVVFERNTLYEDNLKRYIG